MTSDKKISVAGVFPVGLNDIIGLENQKDLIWPVKYSEQSKVNYGRLGALVKLPLQIRDQQVADLVSLVMPLCYGRPFYVLEAVVLADAAVKFGYKIRDCSGLLQYLTTGNDAPSFLSSGMSVKHDLLPIKYSFLRGLGKSIVINSGLSVSGLSSKNITCLSVNPLILKAAKINESFIRIKYPNDLLKSASDANLTYSSSHRNKLVAKSFIMGVLRPPENLDKLIHSRASRLIEAYVEQILNRAADLINMCASVKRLPNNLWLGSDGGLVNRAISHEVIKRGGVVSRFDHGYNRVLTKSKEHLVMLGLSSCTEFVFASRSMRDSWVLNDLKNLLRPEKTFRLLFVDDTDQFKKLACSSKKIFLPNNKPKLLYTPHIYRGDRQLSPSQLWDPMHFKWHQTMSEILKIACSDVFCRPHPEGLLRGKKHPLNEIFRNEKRSFEVAMDDYDGLIFDSPNSRIFIYALLSSKPIIFLNTIPNSFASDVESIIRRRCKVLDVSYDKNNFLCTDKQILLEAVSKLRPPDNKALREIRHLFL